MRPQKVNGDPGHPRDNSELFYFSLANPLLQQYEVCAEDGARTQGGAAKFLQPPVLLKQLPVDVH